MLARLSKPCSNNMIYRRPNSFEQAKTFLVALQGASVDGNQETIRKSLVALEGMDWYDAALGPLYKANAVVAMVTNSLVPVIQELVLEKGALDQQVASVAADKAKARRAEYDKLLAKLGASIQQSRTREVDAEFAAMREAMHGYATSASVQATMHMLYSSSRTARVALKLMTNRIVTSLEEDTAITSTTDIPFEALGL